MYTDIQPVFLATLGQRPQAITMTLDYLGRHYNYQSVNILHTDPERSGIASAYRTLLRHLEHDYVDLHIKCWALNFMTGEPILDIDDLRSAEAYFLAVGEVLCHFRAQNIPIHLLVAGGRKAMSIYATLAAARVLGEHDRVWTIVSAEDLLKEQLFHIPAGRYEDVQIVNLPITPSRQLPITLAERGTKDILADETTPRHRFMSQLSNQEKVLIEALRQRPYASTVELGSQLHKSTKTIENQLRGIYIKLSGYYDMDVPYARKRQVLLDVINQKV